MEGDRISISNAPKLSNVFILTKEEQEEEEVSSAVRSQITRALITWRQN